MATAAAIAATSSSSFAAPTAFVLHAHISVRVNAVHPIDSRQLLLPVASTEDRTAYGKPYAVVVRVNRAPTPHANLERVGTLLAVTKNRRTRVIGTAGPANFGLSMTRRVLTAPSGSSKVSWWRPTRHGVDHGIAASPEGTRYLTSSPTGWIYTDDAGELFNRHVVSGEAAALAVPLPGSNVAFLQAVSGPDGVVVTNRKQIAYVDYLTHAVTPLDSSLRPNGLAVSCYAASTTDAVCGAHRALVASRQTNLFLAPLDGSPSTEIAPTDTCPHAPTLLNDSVVAFQGCHGRLHLVEAGVVRKVPVRVPPWFVDPYPLVASAGQVLVDNHQDSKVLAVSASRKITPYLTAPHAVTEASSFSMSNGQIIWREDDHGPKPSRNTLWQRSIVSSSGGVPLLGKRTAIGSSIPVEGVLRNDGTTVAWAVRNTIVPSGGLLTVPGATLRVQSRHGVKTLHKVNRQRPVDIASDHLLYFDSAGSAHLPNLKTDAARTIDASTARLSGHFLAWLDDSGTVYMRRLGTDTVKTVATGLSAGTTLFLFHAVVGWSTDVCAQNQPCPKRSQYRTWSSPHDAMRLPKDEAIWALTDAGVITEPIDEGTGAVPPGALGDGGLRYYQGESFSLRRYGSRREHVILSGSYFISGPQVSHGVMAWIDPHGVLRTRAIR